CATAKTAIALMPRRSTGRSGALRPAWWCCSRTVPTSRTCLRRFAACPAGGTPDDRGAGGYRSLAAAFIVRSSQARQALSIMHVLSRGRGARRRAEIAVARSGRLRELPRRDHRETRELDGAHRAAPQQSPLRSRRARARGEGQGAGVYRLPHRGRCAADGGAAARGGPVSGLSRNPDGASRRTGYRLCDLSPVARSGGLIDAGGRGGFSRAAFAQRSTLAEPG